MSNPPPDTSLLATALGVLSAGPGPQYEVAIDRLEAHLRAGGERHPLLLILLSRLLFEDAKALMLHSLSEVAQDARRLLLEARIRMRGSEIRLDRIAMDETDLAQLDRELRDAIDEGREHEARLRDRLAQHTSKPSDMAMLAHLVLQRGGDDEFAMSLLRAADATPQWRDEPSGVIPVHRLLS